MMLHCTYEQMKRARPIVYGTGGLGSYLPGEHRDINASFDKIQIDDHVIIMIGDNLIRETKIKEFWREKKKKLMSYADASAVINPTARIGENVYIGANAVIGPNVVIENGTIIHGGCIIEHDTYVQNYTNIGAGAVLAGKTMVFSCSMIGTNVSVLPRMHIGPGAVVGAGAVVTHDVIGKTTVAGVPARILE